MLKGNKKQSEETKQTSEPSSDMVQILELTDKNFKKIIILSSMLRTLMEKKIDNKNG